MTGGRLGERTPEKKGAGRMKADERVPLMILDIHQGKRVEEFLKPPLRSNKRSRSEERPLFRLHVLFGHKHNIFDVEKKKEWVFDTDLQVSRSRYLDMLRMFKDSIVDLERRPTFVTFASRPVPIPFLFSILLTS